MHVFTSSSRNYKIPIISFTCREPITIPHINYMTEEHQVFLNDRYYLLQASLIFAVRFVDEILFYTIKLRI